MRGLTQVTKIDSEVGICTDVGSFFTNLVTAGQEIKNEARLPKNGNPISLSFS